MTIFKTQNRQVEVIFYYQILSFIFFIKKIFQEIMKIINN